MDRMLWDFCTALYGCAHVRASVCMHVICFACLVSLCKCAFVQLQTLLQHYNWKNVGGVCVFSGNTVKCPSKWFIPFVCCHKREISFNTLYIGRWIKIIIWKTSWSHFVLMTEWCSEFNFLWSAQLFPWRQTEKILICKQSESNYRMLITVSATPCA